MLYESIALPTELRRRIVAGSRRGARGGFIVGEFGDGKPNSKLVQFTRQLLADGHNPNPALRVVSI